MEVGQPKDKVQCMHIYVDGTLKSFRSKDRTWSYAPKSPEDLEPIEFCGSGTYFDVGNISDYYARPVKLYRDPFRGGNNILVFCDTYNNKGQPTFANNRFRLLSVVQDKGSTSFTFHQPYSLLRPDGKPLSYMNPLYETDKFSKCGGQLAEAHYRACLYAGIQIMSLETLSSAGQYLYTVRAESLLDTCDEVWISRFILVRLAEEFNVIVCWDSNPSPLLHSVFSGVSLGVSRDEDGERLAESLKTKLGTKEHNTVKIDTVSKLIKVTGLPAESDPYSVAIKVLERERASH